MRVIFMGTPDFAVPTLDALVDAGHEVVLVVAQPDRRAGRGKKMTAPPVARRAAELGLPLAQPKALRSGPFPDRFVATQADVAVVVAYGRILPDQLLDAPKQGCLNIHGSLLPRWRGAAPIQGALLAGDPETGVAVQQMEASLDTGPLYEVRTTPIAADDTTGTLHDRLATLGAEALIATLSDLGTRTPVPQDHDQATWTTKIDKSMGEVDWTQDAAHIDRQVRAMSPWPGGWIRWGEQTLKIRTVRPADGEGAPGEVLSLKPLRIACGEGAIDLIEVQAPGKRPVAGEAFANGAHLEVGQTWS